MVRIIIALAVIFVPASIYLFIKRWVKKEEQSNILRIMKDNQDIGYGDLGDLLPPGVPKPGSEAFSVMIRE